MLSGRGEGEVATLTAAPTNRSPAPASAPATLTPILTLTLTLFTTQAALDELTVLQDGVEGFDTTIARQMVEKELGCAIEEVRPTPALG